jgi:hypothetical protein
MFHRLDVYSQDSQFHCLLMLKTRNRMCGPGSKVSDRSSQAACVYIRSQNLANRVYPQMSYLRGSLIYLVEDTRFSLLRRFLPLVRSLPYEMNKLTDYTIFTDPSSHSAWQRPLDNFIKLAFIPPSQGYGFRME